MPTAILRPTRISPLVCVLLATAFFSPLLWDVTHECRAHDCTHVHVDHDDRALDDLIDEVEALRLALRRVERVVQTQNAAQATVAVPAPPVPTEARSDPAQDVPRGIVERGIGSWMCHDGDRWCGRSSACLLPALDGSGRTEYRRIVDQDHVVAHRTAPCGARIRVCNPHNGLCTVAVKGTSGPFGATLGPTETPLTDRPYRPDTRWTTKIRPDDPGTWRGILDMTTSVRDAIGHSGWGQVTVEVLDDDPTDRDALVQEAYDLLSLSGWAAR